MRSWVSHWGRQVGALLFPVAQCVSCSRPSLGLLCPPCKESAPKKEPICPRCAEILDREGCPACAVEPIPLEKTVALGRHEGAWSRVARRFKETSPWIAPLLAELLVEHLENEEFSAVEAVPMWPERRRERGYNPPALLAKEISRLKGWPFRGRLLRARPTPPQRGLSREERRANLKGAFVCAEGPELFGARILLLDDVMTTGSTLRASSNALLSKGVSSVVAGVVSRD